MDRKPLQQIVGNATRDAEIIKRRDTGEVLTDKDGNPVVGFGMAQSDGYGDDATTTFFDVTTANPGLVQAALDREEGVLKGRTVAVEGTIDPKENYNDKVWAVRIGIVTWFQRSKPGQAVQQSSEDF